MYTLNYTFVANPLYLIFTAHNLIVKKNSTVKSYFKQIHLLFKNARIPMGGIRMRSRIVQLKDQYGMPSS